MPTKLNRAGNQQEYVPAGNGDASGEYGDSTGSNIHFTSFKKPTEPKPTTPGGTTEPKGHLGVEVTNKDGDKPVEVKPQQKYDGKGKEHLKDTLKGRFNRETPNLKILLDSIKDADDEYSGIIGDLYKNNPQIDIKIGKNLNSKYQESSIYNYFTGEYKTSTVVSIGQGVFSDDEDYSKGGVFFHESGHALDYTYVDGSGHRDVWSLGYKSKEFNKNLSEMIEEELSQFKDNDKFNLLKEEANKNKYDWTDELDKEFNDLKAKQFDMNNAVMNDERVKGYSNKINELSNEMLQLRKKRDSYEYYEPEWKELHNKMAEIKDNILKLSNESGKLQETLYKENFPEKEQIKKRIDELCDLKFDMREKSRNYSNVVYGDLSDMIQAVTGKTLTGMGHSSSYWDSRGKHRGKEAFAEIMSAKATNPEALKVLQKYIPNSLKIFDEIIGEIKNGK